MNIFQEMGNESFSDTLGFQLQATKDRFCHLLKHTTSNTRVLQKRQEPVQIIRKNIENVSVSEIKELFSEISKSEIILQSLEKEPEEWEKEGKGQIVFTSEITKPLNDIPFVLPATSIFKIYIFPFFAVLLPLLSWILPYVIMKFFFGIDMPFDHYKKLLIHMWLGGNTWNTMEFSSKLRILFQSAWTLFGVGQGIYQPIQQAFHTKKIDATISEKGYQIQRFVRTTKRLLEKFSILKEKKQEFPLLNEIPTLEPRQTYAYMRDHPNDVKWIFHSLAELELEWCLAKSTDLCFANYSSNKFPRLSAKDFFDPSIPESTRIKSSVEFHNLQNHSIVTGPNKGGKSSNLRALCLNVWMAQTLGLVFAETFTLTPFTWIESGLRLADSPGTESLFEREIQFATRVLKKAQTGALGIVFYDELFHSTNPPDGEKTANIFLNNLWTFSNVISCISTHVFTLVDNAPKRIQRLCVPAKHNELGMEYTFQLAPGVCKVSSVEEIYKKFGFPFSAVKKKNET